MPGRTLKRRMSAGRVKRATSRSGSGRGPMSDMSPRSTLISCGSSSIEVRRMMRPSRVIRGSRTILNTGPFASFIASSEACSLSASRTIERNFSMRNLRRLRP